MAYHLQLRDATRAGFALVISPAELASVRPADLRAKPLPRPIAGAAGERYSDGMRWSQAAGRRVDDTGGPACAPLARRLAHHAFAPAAVLVSGALLSGCFAKVADTRHEEDEQSDWRGTSATRDNGGRHSEPGGPDDFPWGSEEVEACDPDFGFSPASAD